MQNAWVITTPSKSFKVYANEPGIKEQWVTTLQNAITSIIERMQRKTTSDIRGSGIL